MAKTFRGEGWIAAGLAAAVTLPVAALPQYTVTELVAPPEASITDTPAQASVSSLNDAGVIVGHSIAAGSEGSSDIAGLIWPNPDLAAQILTPPDPQSPGSRSVVPFEVGEGGHIVGFASYYPAEETARAVRWNTSNEAQTLLLPTPGATGFGFINRAMAVNQAGDAVGVAFTQSSNPAYLSDGVAAFWAADSTTPIVLPPLEMVDGTESSTARGINDAGLIVGTSAAAVSDDGSGEEGYARLPVAWVDEQIYALDVGRPWDDELYGSANEVAEDGRIVGTDGDRAILWNDYLAAPTFLDPIQSVYDTTESDARAINEDGWIVGDARLDTPGFGTTRVGALWDPHGRGYDLTGLLTEADQTQWIIENPIDINNSGWILAIGESVSDGTSHSLLLRPVDLAGDYNGDGFVSQADLDLVLLNWGDAVVPAEWVATDQFDGVQVSQNELDGVLLNWGSGTPPAVPSFNAIPEPGVAGLVLAGWGGLMCRRPGRGD